MPKATMPMNVSINGSFKTLFIMIISDKPETY
jgi:hypothetical protein